jgi:outer membrane protein assembly factor BamB
MTVSEIAPPPKKSYFLRYGLPAIIVVLVLLNLATLWLWPAQKDLGRGPRLLTAAASVSLLVFLLAAWLLLFSGYSWRRRLGLLLGWLVVSFGGCLAVVRDVEFDGYMRPMVHFRWDPSEEDLNARLETHRRQQAEKPVPGKVVLTEQPHDFPEYRGRHRDGIVTGPALNRDWDAHEPPRLWRQPVGRGYAAFAVAGNAAVTIEQRRDQEAIVCYDAATGHERWAYAYPAHFKERLGGNGPRATPTIAGGEVFSLGASGKLVCLEGTRGEVRWEVDVLEDNDNLMWGMSGSPLVYDQFVVVNPGAQRSSASGRALIAYHRATGRVAWQAGGAKAAYASPMLASLANRRQVLIFDAEGLAGFDAATGEELWRYPWKTYQDINVAQPLVLDGDRVFITSGYDHGCAMLHITRTANHWSAEPVWPKTPNRVLRCKFSSPVYRQGYIYGLDEGRLVCLDARSGAEQWREGDYGHGQILLADDLVVILAESGQLVLVEAIPQEYRELSRFQALEGGKIKTWNYPAMVDGKIFVRNHVDMACYDLAKQ